MSFDCARQPDWLLLGFVWNYEAAYVCGFLAIGAPLGARSAVPP
jgi:hypothetical protein